MQEASDNALEGGDDPAVTARTTLRSLLMRGAEAAALRCVVVGITSRNCPQGVNRWCCWAT